MLFRKRPKGPSQHQGVPFLIRQALMRAERARAEGAYTGAAEIYIRLADEAYARGMLRPGAQMDLEATRAYMEGMDYGRAQARVIHALEAFLGQQRMPRVVMPVVAGVADAMVARGARDEAEAFRDKVHSLLQDHGFSMEHASAAASPAPHERRGRLPAQCPSCYAPLHADEVNWLEADRAQCVYCGSVVLTE